MPTSRPAPSYRAGTSLLLGLLVATLAGLLMAPAATAATTASGVPARAQGQLCSGAGVNVVVDYQSLGGGTVLACDTAGAGKTASQVFADAGVKITPVASFPGAACRVNGKPAQGGCAKMPPADAYWGLYVDKGTSWTYAPKGADELKTADGDFVAFSWQGTKSSTPPGVAPVKPTASASPSPSPSAAASSSSSDAQQQNGLGVGFWVPALVVLLLVVTAVVVLVRRRGRAGL